MHVRNRMVCLAPRSMAISRVLKARAKPDLPSIAITCMPAWSSRNAAMTSGNVAIKSRAATGISRRTATAMRRAASEKPARVWTAISPGCAMRRNVSEESAGQMPRLRRREFTHTRWRENLQTQAIGVFEVNAARVAPFGVRDDAFMQKTRAEYCDFSLGRAHRVEVGNAKRQVVQPRL